MLCNIIVALSNNYLGSQPPEPGAMAHHHHHAKKRAQSRASTASIHSVSTQPNLDQSFASSAVAQHHHHHHPGSFSDQWSANEHNPTHSHNHSHSHSHSHGIPKDLPAPPSQMSADEMMLRPASQLQASQSFAMDSSMHSSVGSAMPYTQHPGMHHPLAAPETFGNGASFTDPDSQVMDRDENEDADSLHGPPTASKPTASRASANNELEMRQLFQANKHRELVEVASELHGNERGPNSERARQVFAMLWCVLFGQKWSRVPVMLMVVGLIPSATKERAPCRGVGCMRTMHPDVRLRE